MQTTTTLTAQPRALDRGDYKTLTLAALGCALEFYDFIIFVFFATVVGALFFPPDIPDWLRQLQTFGIFAAGYFARPLGGIVMAHFGDLLGRKRMFGLSIALMALPTLAMGLLPTYAALGIWAPLLLLALRILQGAAIGGEVPGAWVFVAEHVPEKHTGYACGTLTAGLTFGILLGSLVATWLNTAYSPAEISGWAWRLPFVLGGVFGLIAMYLRRWLHETPVFAELQAKKALADELPLKTVLRGHKRAVLLSMLLTWLLTAGIVVMILMTPTLIQKYGIAPTLALKANSVAVVALTIGCILAGRIVDRIGAGPTFVFGSLFLGAASNVFYHALPTNTPEQLFMLYGVVGLSVGIVGAVPFVMVRAFPAAVRFSGLSFSYNLAYAVFGGLTPVMVSLLIKFDKLAPAHYVLALSVLGALVGACLWVAERRSREGTPNKAKTEKHRG